MREKHVNEKLSRRYNMGEGGPALEPLGRQQGGSIANLLFFFRSVFLPEGYPDSVSKDYISYQGWDTVQAFASSISGSLATAAVLEGVGVGDSTATPLAATLTWVLRDGAGMVGRILFAARCGTGLDYDCKKWRLFADVLNDVAMLIELLTPRLVRPLAMPVLCLASLSRSLVGVAGGASKAAVAQHQARRHNMADLSAKDGSQETMVNLLALLVNLCLLPVVSENPGLVMPLFLALTALHLYANYRAVRSLEFDTLNVGRLDLLVSEYLHHSSILTVLEANAREPLGLSFRRPLIRLGCSLVNCSSVKEWEMVQEAIVDQEQNFVICPRLDGSNLVYLSERARPRDIVKSWIAARLAQEGQKDVSEEILFEMEQVGWRTDRLALQTEGFTIQKE